jgi:hypothetical protein
MCHGPKAIFRQHWQLGCADRDDYHNDERNRGQPCQETDQDQRSAQNFRRPNERASEIRHGNTDFCKPACADGIRKKKFLDALRQKDCADRKANENCPCRRGSVQYAGEHIYGSTVTGAEVARRDASAKSDLCAEEQGEEHITGLTQAGGAALGMRLPTQAGFLSRGGKTMRMRQGTLSAD